MAPKHPKKGQADVSATDAETLLEALQTSGLDDSKLLELVGASQPACDLLKHACKTNRKENPNCFCQLLPAEGSFRKKGLWQKDQMYLNALGPDPAYQRREVDPTIVASARVERTCMAAHPPSLMPTMHFRWPASIAVRRDCHHGCMG